MAHIDAAIPIKAAILLPSNGLLKSIKVKLKSTNPKAIKINIEVKIFM